MNQRCLYCYQELEEGQVDFHPTCAIDFFGRPTAPLYPLERDQLENFQCKRADQSGYTPQLEALAMRLAQSALILTQPASLIRAQDGEMIYITKPSSNSQSVDIAIKQLDGCEFDGSVEMVAEIVEHFSSIARLDVVTLFEQVIFCWVVGCRSTSLSSFALSRPNAGVCSLAPISELSVELATATDKDEFALEINGKRRGIRRSDFEAAMKFMDLKDRIIRITIDKIVNAKEQWGEIIEKSTLSEEQKRAFTDQISDRLKRLSK